MGKNLTVLFLLYCSVSLADECSLWFAKAKIQPGTKSCEIDCSIAPVGMATFQCPAKCKALCAPTEKFGLSYFVFYPGLTPAERRLIDNKPKVAWAAFQAKWKAESSTDRNFPDQGINDEADAFRHFVWAGLMTKELGEVETKEVLEAHEADPDQTAMEKTMDVSNNESGIKASNELSKKGDWELKDLEAKGLEGLRSKKLSVLKPGLKVPKEPK